MKLLKLNQLLKAKGGYILSPKQLHQIDAAERL